MSVAVMTPEQTPEFSASELLRWQEAGCRLGESPSEFYAALFGRFAQDCDRGDTAIARLLAHAPMTLNAAPPLRLMGGVHRGVLTGEFPTLAAAWPSPDGTHMGDVELAYEEIQRLAADPPASVLDAMTRDPQTNEVGRSACLAAGLAQIVAETSLPVRLFEIGASAGLNLRLDHYFYSAGSSSWGDPHSRLRFDDAHFLGHPPFDATPVIVERRGCDIHPLDGATNAGATTLMSYVWPDQTARIERLRSALAVARTMPVVLDRASADDWVKEHVAPLAGTVTVLMHSVMWQYMPAAVQQGVAETVQELAAGATMEAPTAVLEMEPVANTIAMELAITIWPSGERRVVGHCHGHGPPLTWLE